ncbi:MAG: symmetrical bis(5'-nucleosyl)-tetraphosphatase [Ferrovum sp.]|nr:symmetrical bis(5'-nucleosyl)-tetraphosphatase [Ferrovum sp.]NDU88173.1 symmetrical bis(5'-nucleosyl)-tetraphosphatase [Ferrovum sp.]
MSVYVIGDVQGCLEPLESLISRLSLKSEDQLWFVGDIINRGPHSLDTLRFIRSLGSASTMVLGNHELHLLCVAAGGAQMKEGDTLREILDASDSAELLQWLRQRPLIHHQQGVTMVHAGLLPQWSIAQAQDLAQEVEAVLQGPDSDRFFLSMYGNTPTRWHDGLEGVERWRVIVNGFTRLRICSPEGEMDFTYKGKLEGIPLGKLPWFDVPLRRSAGQCVVCGHWSALGLSQRADVVALDTGCLWGGPLTAWRLEDGQVFQVPGMKR